MCPLCAPLMQSEVYLFLYSESYVIGYVLRAIGYAKP